MGAEVPPLATGQRSKLTGRRGRGVAAGAHGSTASRNDRYRSGSDSTSPTIAQHRKTRVMLHLRKPDYSYPPLKHALCTSRTGAERWSNETSCASALRQPPDLICRFTSSHSCSVRRDADPFRTHHNSHYVAVRDNALARGVPILLFRQPLLHMCTSGAPALMQSLAHQTTTGEPDHMVGCLFCVCVGVVLCVAQVLGRGNMSCSS